MKTKILLSLCILVSSLVLQAQKWNPIIEVFGSPVIHIFEKVENENISQSFNYSVGLLVGNKFHFKKNSFTIRTGYFIDTKYYNNQLSYDIVGYPNEAHTKFLYRNLPFLLDFQLNTGNKFQPFVSVGYIFGKILKKERIWVYDNKEVKDEMKENEEGDYPGYIYSSVGMKYFLNKNFSVQGEPFFKYCTTNGSAFYNYDRDSRISIGLKLGLEYNFKI